MLSTLSGSWKKKRKKGERRNSINKTSKLARFAEAFAAATPSHSVLANNAAFMLLFILLGAEPDGGC